MFQYGTELAARKRADPRDDIATSLLHAEVDGQSLTDFEFNLFFILLDERRWRHDPQLGRVRHSGPDGAPCRAARLEADPSLSCTSRRGTAALRQPGNLLRSHRDQGHRIARHPRQGRRAGGDVLSVGQPR